MLALSRVEYGELDIADERVDLVELLKKAIELHLPERDIAFTCELPAAYVRGDAERLTQVFDNLLRNAIKYSPGGESVQVELRAREDNYVVAGTDRGIGIPSDELPKLFARFSRGSKMRSERRSPGPGLGSSSSR